ncbi:MAG: hydrolase [Oscillospiraceae bacterium]|jgi:predicted hydrolase (HD superfamily)|nr:hydrolase [Oscillospiraceae bacterium]
MDITQAREILEKYNKEPFHLRHAEVVSGVMRHFAKQYDADSADKWALVGLLHDIDFELYPDEHCVKGEELLCENNVDESIIRSCMSHGYGLTGTPHRPEHIMEKILFAADELTGLIGAVAIMRPSKSVQDLEVASVKKKFKDKKFAAGCSRDVIAQGAQALGWTLDELIERTILAMRTPEVPQPRLGAAEN